MVTMLQKRLKRYDLHRPSRLAAFMGCHRSQASRWLSDERLMSVDTAQRIARLIKIPWEKVYRWHHPNSR